MFIIINNAATSVLTYSTVHNKQLGEVCSFQFFNYEVNLDSSVVRNETLTELKWLVPCTYTAPIYFIRGSFRSYLWLLDTAFKAAKFDVFNHTLKLCHISIDCITLSLLNLHRLGNWTCFNGEIDNYIKT